MSKKISKKLLFLSQLILLPTVSQAGTMGSDFDKQVTTPYLSGEGSYTWSSIKNVSTRGIYSQLSKNHWGGRLAAGVIRPYVNNFSFNAEFGGGYYGNTTAQNPSGGFNLSRTITGYDFLVGGLYHLKQVTSSKTSLFFDVGAMVENMLSSSLESYSQLVTGGRLDGVYRIKQYRTAMLPEIKTGVIFQLVSNLDVTLSYLHVFGSVTSSSTSLGSQSTFDRETLTFDGNRLLRSGNAILLNPSLNSIMLGLRYNFVG